MTDVPTRETNPLYYLDATTALGYSILKGPDGIDGFAIHSRSAEPAHSRSLDQPVRVGWVADAAFRLIEDGNKLNNRRPNL